MIVRPPALATWLLNHLISGPNSESLVGDLVERYQEKCSALWFWRQTVIAIIASFAVQLWRHRWIASSEKGLWLHAWASRLPNGEAGRRLIFELRPEDSKKHGVRGGR